MRGVSARRVLGWTRRSNRPFRKGSTTGRCAETSTQENPMLDSSNPSETPVTAAWRDRLAHGDVVLFRFPLAGPAAPHRPVPPPCLVLGVEIIRGRYCAVLAPAMPSCRTSAPGRRVVVDRRPGWRAAGPERAQSRDRQRRGAGARFHGRAAQYPPTAPAGPGHR